MLKYRYRFPLTGQIGSEKDKEGFKDEVNRQLNGPWGVYFCFMAEKHAERVEGISLNEDKDGNLESIDLTAYMKLEDGAESKLIEAMNECTQMGLDASSYDDAEILDIETLQFIGIEGELPKTAYHITERENLETIMEKGLIPDQGKNSYKDIYNHVYLTDKETLPAWLSVLPSTSNPVILEVDVAQIEGFEQGRVYGDRPHMEHHFGEYRTKSTIPSSAIKEADIKGEFAHDILKAVTEQFDHAVKYVENKRARVTDEDIEKIKNRAGRWIEDDFAEPINETLTGLERLSKMGVIEKDEIGDMLRERKIPELMQDLIKTGLAPTKSARYILDTYCDNWADEISDGFTDGVNQIQADEQDINK